VKAEKDYSRSHTRTAKFRLF